MAVIFKRRTLASVLTAALALQANQASALGLVQAYEAALQNDPTYLGAVHERDAGQQNRVLGRSNLLPSVSASYSKLNNRADYTSPNFAGQLTTTHPVYDSASKSIGLRQPLVNLDGVARYHQGMAQADYSDAQFSGRSQELMVRLVSAYSDAKYAEDQLALATVQRDTFAEQKLVNERMFQKGEGTRTDMLETQAKYDLAEAQLIEARDNMTTARNTLAAIIGSEVAQLDSLSEDFRVKPMLPATFEEWKAFALEHNADIAAQRYVVEASKQEINKNRAGHMPRIDLVASLNKGSWVTLSTLNQESTVRSIGVQINIPLYSGGSVSAATSQAVANYEKAKSELDAKTNQVLVELRKQYDLVLSGASRIDALVKSVNSARTLVQATQQSVKGGVRINLDVLNAQQQLFTAQRDLALARYNYLISYLRLRYSAGMLTQEDLHTVAGYFHNVGNASPVRTASEPTPAVSKATEGIVSPVNGMASIAASTSPDMAASNVTTTGHEDLLKFVAAWAQAWSAQDMKTYFGFYASDFKPESGMSRDAWEKARRARIQGAGRIAVQAAGPEVTMNGDTAIVKFRQVYKSDRVTDETRKVLMLTKQDGQWKIKQESRAS